jgi:hypothetical protein
MERLYARDDELYRKLDDLTAALNKYTGAAMAWQQAKERDCAGQLRRTASLEHTLYGGERGPGLVDTVTRLQERVKLLVWLAATTVGLLVLICGGMVVSWVTGALP